MCWEWSDCNLCLGLPFYTQPFGQDNYPHLNLDQYSFSGLHRVTTCLRQLRRGPGSAMGTNSLFWIDFSESPREMTFFNSILQVRAIFECGNQVLEHGIVFNDMASLFLAKIVSKSATLIAPGTLQLKILNGHWAVGQLRSSDLQPLAFQVESNGSLPSQSRRMKGRSESRFFPPLSPCGVAKDRRPIATYIYL